MVNPRKTMYYNLFLELYFEAEYNAAFQMPEESGAAMCSAPADTPPGRPRRQAAARYPVRKTIPLTAEMWADVMTLAIAADVTPPEAVRRAIAAGLPAEQRRAAREQKRRDAAEFDEALMKYDPGAPSTRTSEAGEEA